MEKIQRVTSISGDFFSDELIVRPSLDLIDHHMQGNYKAAFASTESKFNRATPMAFSQIKEDLVKRSVNFWRGQPALY